MSFSLPFLAPDERLTRSLFVAECEELKVDPFEAFMRACGRMYRYHQ